MQISVNGGDFKDLLQLSGDPMSYWLHSPVINLTGAEYRGQTVRIRFHFDMVDFYYRSGYLGWLVDNVSLNTTARIFPVRKAPPMTPPPVPPPSALAAARAASFAAGATWITTPSVPQPASA